MRRSWVMNNLEEIQILGHVTLKTFNVVNDLFFTNNTLSYVMFSLEYHQLSTTKYSMYSSEFLCLAYQTAIIHSYGT